MPKLEFSSLPRSREAIRSKCSTTPGGLTLLMLGFLVMMYLAWMFMILTWDAQDHCSFWTEPLFGRVKLLHAVYGLYAIILAPVLAQVMTQSWIESLVQLALAACFIVAIEGIISVTADAQRPVGRLLWEFAPSPPDYWYDDEFGLFPQDLTTCGPMPPQRS